MMDSPKSVAIVAMGRSYQTYVNLACRLGSRHRVADEIWGINCMGPVLHCDRVFMMDDLARAVHNGTQALHLKGAQITQLIGSLDDALTGAECDAGLTQWLPTYRGILYTPKAYPELCPGSVAFPLAEVVQSLGGMAYFNTTIAYAICFGIHLKVRYGVLERMALYGCDYTYPDRAIAEAGRACAEFWIGKFDHYGIKLTLPADTTLLDANTPPERLYGYPDPVQIDKDDDGLAKVTAYGVTTKATPVVQAAPAAPPKPKSVAKRKKTTRRRSQKR